MKQIPLTQGKFALVDDQDFELINKFKWCAHKMGNTFYADRGIRVDGKCKTILMHRFILGITEKTSPVDHKNFNGLDNRRCNIRPCTQSQNNMNRKSYANSSSIYKGVIYRNDNKKWYARIRINGKNKNIGSFSNEIDAAKAYDFYALQLYKEFANTNF